MRGRAAVLLVSAALAGCGGEERASEGVPAAAQDPGPVHVHGLGVDAKTRALYVATHTGLWRVPEGSTSATRVGDRRQDTMGFTVAEPGVFLGSGHPDARDDLPPLLGLVRSTDGGRTWESVSLLGEADFHVLEAAGDRIYGFDATDGTLHVSDDRGRTWTTRGVPEPLVDLAIDPSDADHVVASGGAELYESRDAGTSWRPLGAAAGLLAWPQPDRLYRIEADGRVSVAPGAAREFRPLGAVGGPPEAFLAADGELYVAVHERGIEQSSDGGRTWRLRYSR